MIALFSVFFVSACDKTIIDISPKETTSTITLPSVNTINNAGNANSSEDDILIDGLDDALTELEQLSNLTN